VRKFPAASWKNADVPALSAPKPRPERLRTPPAEAGFLSLTNALVNAVWVRFRRAADDRGNGARRVLIHNGPRSLAHVARQFHSPRSDNLAPGTEVSPSSAFSPTARAAGTLMLQNHPLGRYCRVGTCSTCRFPPWGDGRLPPTEPTPRHPSFRSKADTLAGVTY
jgi:hypothetical protein